MKSYRKLIVLLCMLAPAVIPPHSDAQTQTQTQTQTQRLPNPGQLAESIAQLVETATAGKGRVEVKVGEWDSRMQLAPCQRAEPVLLPGTRLWGRSQISIRCVEGAQWTVLLPITVSVFGNALIAKRNLNAGTTVQGSDFELEAIDLTKDNAQWVSDPAILEGKTITRSLVIGQALRSDHLKTPPSINSGDIVKVRVPGEGFSISTDAVALASAATGQTVRLRTESGKVLSGLVREGYVEVKP